MLKNIRYLFAELKPFNIGNELKMLLMLFVAMAEMIVLWRIQKILWGVFGHFCKQFALDKHIFKTAMFFLCDPNKQ